MALAQIIQNSNARMQVLLFTFDRNAVKKNILDKTLNTVFTAF